MRKMLIESAALLALISTAFAQSAPTKISETSKGKALTDEKGMTLYIFDRDSAGKSMCNDQCAANWPPLMAADNSKAAADYSVITRDDGKKQWAYKGMPLYGWVKDKAPGDVSGDGVNNVWHIARP